MTLPPFPGAVPRSRLRDLAALALVLALLAAAALAFVLPWLPQRPASAALDRYAPARDGAAWLTVTLGPDGAPRSWASGTQELVPATRALATNLRRAQSLALRTFYGAPGEPAGLDETLARLADTGALVLRAGERELSATGLLTDSVGLTVRTADGDFVLGFYRPDTDQDLLFEPALLALPGELTPGTAWEREGMLGGQIGYRFAGSVLAQEAYHGPAGSFADCVRVETRLVLSLEDQTLDDSLNRAWQCAGVGGVESERLGPDGGLISRTVLVASNVAPGGAAAGLPLPPGAHGRPDASAALPAADGAAWELARVGRALPAFESGSATFAPVWIPGEPPLVLAAGYDGALTAFDAGDPAGPARWRFAIDGTFFGQPAYDPASGRIFVGASDKRLYALDVRGLYLWSFQADDNIATRPALAGGVVVFGSEDRAVYGVDAVTGRLAWRRPFETTGPVVSSPAVAGNVVLIGSDDGQVYGLDPATGEERWPPLAAEDAVEAPVVVAGGTAYAASRDGTLYGLDPATGEEVWRAQAGNPLRTAPAVGAGRAFVVDELGYLKALDLSSGRRLWVSAGDDYVGPPLLVGPEASPALAVARADGVVALLDLDGRAQREWHARDVASPVEDPPSLAFGPTAGGGALWLADDNAVVMRLGAPRAGAAALRPAWYRPAAAAPFAGAEGSGLYATAAEYHGRAVALDSGGNVYLVDPADGRAELVGRYDGERGLPVYVPDPVVAGDTLLIAAGASLGAFDLRDGRTLWRVAAAGEARAMQPPAVAGDTVLWAVGAAGGAAGRLYALGLADGVARWEVELSGFMAAGGVVVRGDRVYTSAPPAAFELGSGRELWRTTGLGPGLGGAALSESGDTLFVATATDPAGEIAAIDTDDGTVRWRAALDAALSFGERLWLSDGALIVPAFDGQVLALDPANGAELWRAAPGPRWGAASVAGGRVWQTNADGRVAVLDARDGRLTHFYTALEPNLELIGRAGGRPTLIGGRMILPYSSALLAFEVP